jgi:hypothetical protein
MASDVRIYDGTNWQSLKGPAGPQGPEGPTVVSADAVNCAKLGSDGKILVAQADLDSRYVNVTGDTMTGQLKIVTASSPASDPPLVVSTESGQSQILLSSATATASSPRLLMRNQRGTLAAPAPLQNNDPLGAVNFQAAGTDGVLRGLAVYSASAKSAQGPNGYDVLLTIAANCSDSTKPQAVFGMFNSASTGSYCYITTDKFVVGTDGSINCASGITSRAGNVIVQEGWLSISDGACVSRRLDTGAAGDFAANTTDATKPTYGVVATASGESSSSVGLRVEATCTTAGSPVTGIQIVSTPKQANCYALFSGADADSYFKGNLGINWTTPTVPLEVNGTARIRGLLETTGNITSTGTAHSFANGSIPAAAVAGIVAGTPASGAAAGVAGSVRYDANFLYVCVSANVWKRVALTAF